MAETATTSVQEWRQRVTASWRPRLLYPVNLRPPLYSVAVWAEPWSPWKTSHGVGLAKTKARVPHLVTIRPMPGVVDRKKPPGYGRLKGCKDA